MRRFVAVAALAVWQGGFAFYGAFVVPAGQRVLGSHLAQGLVTQEVSRALNLVGVATLALLAWEALSTPRARLARSAAWAVMAAILVALFALHPAMDAHLSSLPPAIADVPGFDRLHRVYLLLSTAQWLAAAAYLWLTVDVAPSSDDA